MAEAGARNQGVWLSEFKAPLKLIDNPVPRATSGSAVVKVLGTFVLPYIGRIHRGELPQTNLMLPLIPGANCIGEVVEIGPDAARLKRGDMVWVDSTIHARDDSSIQIVQGHLGGEDDRGRVLMQGEWRDGSWQKYQKVPLESCHVLDRDCLFKQHKYTIPELTPIILYTVAAGAIIEVAQVKTGDVLVMGPATGSFGGAAVQLALLAGAFVIVLGRRQETLAELRNNLSHPERLSTLVVTGDVDADGEAIRKLTPNGQGADIYNDWTPGWLEKPPFLPAAMKALKNHGRVILSGAAWGKFEIPYASSVHMNFQYTARWTCTRDTIARVVTMLHQGILKIGKSTGVEIKTFKLEEHQEAKDHAEQVGRFKNYTVIEPNGPQ